MNLHDLEAKSPLRLVGMGLTATEARELRDSFDDLMAHDDPERHNHVSSADFQTELTIWIDHGE